jgi:hypothetical protein
MNPKRIELNIDELVLHGFPYKDRLHIGRAVERELSRMISRQGMPPKGMEAREVHRMDGGAFQVTSNAKPKAIGTQVAQAVYRGLNR